MCPHGAYTCWGPQGSINVHVALCMPIYNSELRTLHIYACVCICEACERCFLIELSVMKIIEINFIVVWIFYSFNDIFVSSWVCKIFVRMVWIA